MELSHLRRLSHTLEIDSDNAALVRLRGSAILARGCSVLAGWGSVLARWGTGVATAASAALRALALLTQQDLANLLQQLRVYVLSLGRLVATAHGLVSTTSARGKATAAATGRVSTATA